MVLFDIENSGYLTTSSGMRKATCDALRWNVVRGKPDEAEPFARAAADHF
jgi:hypothetical protein